MMITKVVVDSDSSIAVLLVSRSHSLN